MQEKELQESFLLCQIRGIGAASIRRLMEEAGSAEAACRLHRERVITLLGVKKAECLERGLDNKNRAAALRRYERMRERGIFFLPAWHEDYPDRLKGIADAPAALYGKGKLPETSQKAVAVIGARACSGYGKEAAGYFASGLAKAGVTVVSGMARGVDGIAGLAALEAGGISVAVLGCGVDICYPTENQSLYERLEKEGCLLSEYPPGTQPQARLFPPRNRIISGLADLVLVIEAREKSGTLITVDMALEQGRDVFAVPGRITDRCSAGCNRLIGNGAGMAVSVSQVLQELGITPADNCGGQKAADADPNAPGRPFSARALAVLDCNPKSLDEIHALVLADGKNPAPTALQLMQELVLLSLEGEVGSSAGMYFLRKIQNFFPCKAEGYGV